MTAAPGGRVSAGRVRASGRKVPCPSLLSLSLAWPPGCLHGRGCTSSPETLQAKLDEIGNERSRRISCNDLPAKAKGAVLAKPYYVVDEFKEFQGDTAIVFQAYATAGLLLPGPVPWTCARSAKYRYKTSLRIWDRYEVKLKHFRKNILAPRPNSVLQWAGIGKH